ncbi:hypothetical protein K2X30_08460 [bacterium]|nr:hypothetical protein [bacterium]
MELDRNKTIKVVSPHIPPPNVTSEQADVITEDLATYGVVHYVLFSAPTTLDAVKEYFSFDPSLAPVVDQVIANMEDRELISIEGGVIRAKRTDIHFAPNPRYFSRFIPSLFELASKQVAEDGEKGIHIERKEGLHLIAIPNTPEVAIKAQAIFEEYRAKLIALSRSTENMRSEEIRILGTYNCLLDPKGFV